jgi:hypothetical protein
MHGAGDSERWGTLERMRNNLEARGIDINSTTSIYIRSLQINLTETSRVRDDAVRTMERSNEGSPAWKAAARNLEYADAVLKNTRLEIDRLIAQPSSVRLYMSPAPTR